MQCLNGRTGQSDIENPSAVHLQANFVVREVESLNPARQDVLRTQPIRWRHSQKDVATSKSHAEGSIHGPIPVGDLQPAARRITSQRATLRISADNTNIKEILNSGQIGNAFLKRLAQDVNGFAFSDNPTCLQQQKALAQRQRFGAVVSDIKNRDSHS